MSVLQSTQSELRYTRRANLEQEASIIGNYYRDIIRSYGVDCNYYKLDLSEFDDFKNIIDRNVILKHAYGYNITPDYTMSAEMLTYMEVENDIFQLQKFGYTPNTDVNFYFDSIDFACDIATKAGQYKEYKIKEKEIIREIPDITVQSFSLSDTYECHMLSGKLSTCIDIEQAEIDAEYTTTCHPYEHTDFFVVFPSNKNLYRSLIRKLCNDDYLDTLILLTYKIEKQTIAAETYKYYLKGKITGSILFYDLNSIGKYLEKTHPMVGDIVTIDFPDETNREQYEITDCFEKQLTPDGISPLLHKYIWKCRARRYVNSYEKVEHNEANDRIEEKIRFDDNVKDAIGKEISLYEDGEDAAYGGYDGVENKYDSKIIDKDKCRNCISLDGIMTIPIITFGCGSRLITTGYELIFVSTTDEAVKIVTKETEPEEPAKLCICGIKWLKASDNCVTFVDIEGTSTKLAENIKATQHELEMCLDSLYDSTHGDNINKNGDNFIKFTGTKTYLWATPSDLYVKLASAEMLFKLT